MRLKGISWIEQHFEKVFAAVFGVAAIGVLTYQFAGKPNTVKVANKDVPIEEAYTEVVSAAQRTRGQVEAIPTDLPTLNEQTNPVAQFEKAYRGPTAPAPQLAAAFGEAGGLPAGADGSLDQRLAAPLPELKIPALPKPLAYPYMTTVHPAEVQADPAVAAVMPQQPPFDKAHVTVEARFSGPALRAMLETDPDGPGPIRAIPKSWWEGMQILEFALERQELKPDGTWSEPVAVAPMPGRFSLAPDIAKGVPNADTLNSLRVMASERATEIWRPEYYHPWMGDAWAPPSVQIEQEKQFAAGDPSRARKMNELAAVERELANLRDRRAAMGPMQSGGREQPGEAGGGGGKAPGRGRQPQQQPDRQYTDAQRRQLDERIARTEARLARLQSDLGIQTTEAEPAAGQPAERGVRQPGQALSIFDLDDLQLWAHDVTVERGKRYRYRASLVMPNPLFGKGAVMVPEQAEWSRSTLVRSAPSEWTDPVDVPDNAYWFIVGASQAGGQLSNRAADARAELYVFTMGYWRRGTTTVEPGDQIAAEVNVPDAAKLVAMLPASTEAPVAPTETEPAGGGSKRAPSVVRRGQPEQPAQGEAPADIPMVEQVVSVDAVLLGVGGVPLAAGERPVVQTYLKVNGSTVETRIPDQERSRREYAVVSRSAEAAREAAALRDAPPEQQRSRPEQERPMPEPPPSSGGGGGSGGGG